jgi:hypothetical protein
MAQGLPPNDLQSKGLHEEGNGLQDLAREVDAEAAAANKSVSGQRLG